VEAKRFTLGVIAVLVAVAFTPAALADAPQGTESACEDAWDEETCAFIDWYAECMSHGNADHAAKCTAVACVEHAPRGACGLLGFVLACMRVTELAEGSDDGGGDGSADGGSKPERNPVTACIEAACATAGGGVTRAGSVASSCAARACMVIGNATDYEGRVPDCVDAACDAVIAASDMSADSCVTLVCERLHEALEGDVDCEETLCRDVPRIVETVRVPVDDAIGLLGETIPLPDVVKRVLVQAGFKCDPRSGSGGSGERCEDLVVTNDARVTFGAHVHVDDRYGSARGSECASASTSVTGSHSARQNGEVTFTPGGPCSADVDGNVNAGGEREQPHFGVTC
jgi:hypothetical protein